MINIRLNETICSLELGQSLHDILVREGYTNACFAIAVNKQFLPRAEYATTFLKEGDCVEMISPMQGG